MIEIAHQPLGPHQAQARPNPRLSIQSRDYADHCQQPQNRNPTTTAPAVDAVLAEERPDFVFAQGDITTELVTGLCSYYRKIPFGHVDAVADWLQRSNRP